MVFQWREAIVVEGRVSEANRSEECSPVAGKGSLAWNIAPKKGEGDIHMGGQWPSKRSQRTSQVRRLPVCVCVCVCVCRAGVAQCEVSEPK